MTIEPAEPRPQRGETLTALEREDLDLYGVGELSERIERLQAEIARAERARDKKRSGRAAAEQLFSFGNG